MGLEDLNSQLYSRDDADDRSKTENQYEPDLQDNLAKQNISRLEVDGHQWQPIHHQKTLGEKVSFWWADHQRAVYIVSAVIIVVAGLGGGAWYWYQQFFSEKNTVITLVTEEQVKSGQLVTASVTTRNENRTTLENVSIVIELPDGFVPELSLNGWEISGNRASKEIGLLTHGQEEKVALPGKLFGNKGAVATFKAITEYSPAKISGRYSVHTEAKTLILSSPLTLQVAAPATLVTGQELDYELVYKNESNETFDNVRIKATFPEGFTFTTATPTTNARDTWFVSTFRPGDTAKIVVRGTLEGVWNEKKEVKFALGYEAGSGEFIAYNEGTATTQITASPLSIKQVVNDGNAGPVTPGNILAYTIQYQNNSSQGYRDVVIAVSFENPEFLDWENLDLPQGAYDEKTKTIYWRAGEVQELKALAPGATGMLNFNIPIIPDFSNAGVVKNKAIVSKATIDSPDVQSTLAQNKLVGSSSLRIPLGTLVGLQMYTYQNDAFIDNEGPLPPEVGEKTQYAVRLRVTNPANDVTQGKVVVVLPGYMKYTGKKYPEDGNISYNERSNEITWSVGSMSPGASKEVRVQTEFSPGSNLAGKDFLMVQSAVFTGTDSFTKQNITVTLVRNDNTLSDEADLPSDYNKVKK